MREAGTISASLWRQDRQKTRVTKHKETGRLSPRARIRPRPGSYRLIESLTRAFPRSSKHTKSLLEKNGTWEFLKTQRRSKDYLILLIIVVFQKCYRAGLRDMLMNRNMQILNRSSSFKKFIFLTYHAHSFDQLQHFYRVRMSISVHIFKCWKCKLWNFKFELWKMEREIFLLVLHTNVFKHAESI